MSTRFLVALAGLAAAPLLAQLASPTGNPGVAMGHLHLAVRDVDAQRKFWVAFGGTPLKNGTLEVIEFPGVYVMLRQGEPTGGSVGSVVNHVGFNARNSAESVAKWQAAGLKTEPGNAAGQFYLTTADGLRIEILEDKTIATPLKFHHVHFNFTADQVTAVQAWYARIFDARPGTRGRFKSGDIAGANLTYGEANEKAAPTKGRAGSHRIRSREHGSIRAKAASAGNRVRHASAYRAERDHQDRVPHRSVGNVHRTDAGVGSGQVTRL